MEVICDHAGVAEVCGGCNHGEAHEFRSSCEGDTCNWTKLKAQCIPVATKKDRDELLVRLKEQITGTKRAQVYDTRVNQILIMEALVELLEASK